MRYLITCDNFSGPLVPVARWLNSLADSETLLASDRIRYPVGLKKIILKTSPAKAALQDSLDYAAAIIQQARYAKRIFQGVRENGFYPDRIFMFSASGISLASLDAFPEAQAIFFPECDSADNRQKARAFAALRSQLILDSAFAFAFSRDSIATLPKPLQPCARLAPLCVDPSLYPASPEKPLTVFYLKNLAAEPLKHWLDVAMRHAQNGHTALFLPSNQQARRLQQKLGPLLAWAGCNPSLDTARKVFSQCALFISPAAELSYDMLAAMSCGACAVSAVRTTLLTPNRDYLPLQDERSLQVSAQEARRIGQAARQTIRASFEAAKIIPEFLKEVF